MKLLNCNQCLFENYYHIKITDLRVRRAPKQTADHVLIAYTIHRAPHGARGLTVLDDETRCWLYTITGGSSIQAVQHLG